MTEPLVEVSDLRVSVGEVEAVHGVSFTLPRGRRTGLIGESGSGKTVTALALMGLLPDGLTARGSVAYRSTELLDLSEQELCRLRGDRLAMIFQEPLSALNPLMRVGDQVAEPLRIHRGMSRAEARAHARELLERVQIPDVLEKMRAYPHQLSGGQRQRAMIAMAMACSPELVVADEPTTALDVTVQAQVLRTLNRLVEEEGATLLLITHDLPVVAEVCEQVLVMYGGYIVEEGATEEVFAQPRHPYTRGLIDAIPPLDRDLPDRHLRAIAGTVPALGEFPAGCPFRNRCPRADRLCEEMPPLSGDDHRVACWHPVQ
ncbi:MAG: ABC transporter ATP-binding protein [Candidatus Nephthysia bennettiae]|uniref:ABC transporter ATP-binding protein n=1 Tax=Candidatus Nephthysia bennettiae TaxID=3127016 RepID=A0A934NAE3_9BACT|nr:ABC transporter ATP-binding protein [Candidatus Dormibacteraeota bacterium]MBJ7612640.1 ABC transporter ATP-binding protein [Candidatus Dormibacteraeota bacterium]PZR97419.1 MAG: ABC transporter ATP-binding protein [Candidatus Dormibacteraeota bacterium]